MPNIVFQFEIEAEPAHVAEAIASEDGIRGWWTDSAEVPEGTGGVIRLGFAMAPLAFELRVDERSDEAVRWASVGAFPPHWADTELRWQLAASEGGGTSVEFRHTSWPSDDGMFGATAFTWGRLMLSLKSYVETGSTDLRLPSAPLE